MKHARILAVILTAVVWVVGTGFSACPSMDVAGNDCRVDLADFAVFASQWLTEGTLPPAMTWVTITDPGVAGHERFHGQMSKYETTNTQYARYLNEALAAGEIEVEDYKVAENQYWDVVVGYSGPYSGQSYYRLDGPGSDTDGVFDGGASRIDFTGSVFTVQAGFEDHPVTYVTWYGAMAFAHHYGWRLPTQWEWLAAADFDGTYTCGCGAAINNTIANYRGSTHPYGTTPVGSFGTYGYGLANIAANVGEWTSSKISGFATYKGGGWFTPEGGCIVASSGAGVNPDNYFASAVGFRVCRDLTAEPDITWVAIDDPGVSGTFSGEMSQYETTNAQFCQYLNAAWAAGDIVVSGDYVEGTAGPYANENYYDLTGAGDDFDGAVAGGAARINWSGGVFTVDPGFEDHPVTYASWYGAMAFAAHYGWRLPTEWEWQAVADFDGSYNYGCGTTIDNDRANYRNSTHPDGTTPVGAFGSYGYGIADMAGNVWDMTSSIIESSVIMRGGAWYENAVTVSYRGGMPLTNMGNGSGFRVCR